VVDPPIPVPDPETSGFWASTAEGVLSLCRCTECRKWMHPPLERCRHCGGPTGFEPASGRGRVYSYIVVHHRAVPGLPVPYVIATVELEDQVGLRMAGIVRAEPDAVRVDAPVQVRLSPVGRSEFVGPEFDLRDP
jgi:uncharacterized protein